MWLYLKTHAVELKLASICLCAIAFLAAAVSWRSHWLDYEAFIPTSGDRQPMPALVVLHGRSGDASTLRSWLGFDEFAEHFGFIVIYPQSHQDGWDFGVGLRERLQTGRRSIDHTRYILDIVDEVDSTNPIDRKRMFVAGVSDGASMAVRMSCREPDAFQGLISVAATLPYYAIQDCTGKVSLSVLLIHGLQDTVMPWKGTTYKEYKVFLSMEESIDWWSTRNDCHSLPAAKLDYKSLAGQVDVLQIKHCRHATGITVYRINDGGHTWPGRDHPLKRTRGHMSRDIDATRVISHWAASLM